MISFLPMALALLTQVLPSAASPTLHRRADYNTGSIPASVVWKSSPVVLPEDATGFYKFRDRNQGVQLVSHGGEVSGFLLKFAEGKSDKGLIVGYVFGKISADRGRLSFTTQEVHGVWYDFEGRLTTGSRFNPFEPGYYVLEGKLTAHDEDQQTVREAAIRLPSTGRR